MTKEEAVKRVLECVVDCRSMFYGEYLDYCSELELKPEDIQGSEQSNHIYALALIGLGLNFPEEFKLDKDAEIDGTSRKGEITSTYSKLAQLFGEAEESDGYKCSGQWVFTSDEGEVFTVYDWKETELYDSELPSVKEFRESKESTTFNVGGRYGSDHVSFINWLKKKLA